MNTGRALMLSAAVNLALLAGYVVVWRAPKPVPTAETPGAAGPRRATSERVPSQAPVPSSQEAATAKDWTPLPGEELRGWIARLRASGCPETTIRDLVQGRVRRIYAARLRIQLPRNPDRYWEAGADLNLAQERQRQRLALAKEEAKLLADLLGPDGQAELEALYAVGNDHWDYQLGFLDEAKRGRVRQIQEQFAESEQALHRQHPDPWDPAYQQEARRLRDQRTAALAAVLSPQELEQYELRVSPLANQLRWDLAQFKPTEAEFREIYRIRKAFEQELMPRHEDPDDPASGDGRLRIEKEILERIGMGLSPERFADYQRLQDPDYRNLLQIAQQNQLSTEAALKVYQMRQIAEDQARRIREDNALGEEEREAALKAIRAETERTVSATLGDKAFATYRNQNGWWMRMLSPGTASPIPAPPPGNNP